MSGVPVPTGVSDRFVVAYMQVTEERFAAIPVTACLVWDLANAPESALVHIADGLGMRRVLSGAELRTALPNGWSLLGRRGTPEGLRAALEAMGYAVALVAGLDGVVCDGSVDASGEPYRCGSDARWSVCQVHVTNLTEAVSAEQLRGLWDAVDYFSRRAVRHILTVHDATGSHTYRDHSTVPEAS